VSISLVIQRRTFRKERDSRGRDHILIGFADGRRLYLGTPVSSTNITDLRNPNPHYILLALKWRVDQNVTKNHRKLKKKTLVMIDTSWIRWCKSMHYAIVNQNCY
jgi:hypothetical protein